MRTLISLVAVFAALISASVSSAGLNVTSAQDGGAGVDLVVTSGDLVTIDITITTTVPEARQLGLRAANYDPTILTAGAGTIIPAVIFGLYDGGAVPLGGIDNNATGAEQAPLAGVRAGWSINLFQGSSAFTAFTAGPATFQIQFVAGAAGTTTVDVGTFANYSDTYFGTLSNNIVNPAAVTVQVLPFSPIEVTKTATPDSLVEPGGNVTFTFRVDNLDDAESLTLDSLDDSIYGDLNGQGDCSVPQVIAASGFYECSFMTSVTGNAGDTEMNVVTAHGTAADLSSASDTDSEIVTITDSPSMILADKVATPDSVVAPGGMVTFDYSVDNLSTVDTVTIDTLNDDIHGDLHGQGDCGVPQILAPLGSYVCSITVMVAGGGGSIETNIFTASGTDDDSAVVMDDATETVDILVAPGSIITPVAVVSTSNWGGGASDGRDDNLIDGSGLSGVGAVESQTHDDDGNAATMWHTGDVDGGLGGPLGVPPAVNTQEVVFDLGSGRDLTGSFIWNMNQSGNSNRGVDQFEILTSGDSDPLSASFTSAGTFNLSEASGGAEPAQHVAFSAVEARLVKFRLNTHHGSSPPFVGLSEVRFVPEPGVGASLLCGAWLLGLMSLRHRGGARR